MLAPLRDFVLDQRFIIFILITFKKLTIFRIWGFIVKVIVKITILIINLVGFRGRLILLRQLVVPKLIRPLITKPEPKVIIISFFDLGWQYFLFDLLSIPILHLLRYLLRRFFFFNLPIFD